MTETLMETNLPDKISTMSVDDMMKLTGQSADAPTTSKGLSRLSINHSAEDEEGSHQTLYENVFVLSMG
mgnify:CR=1 FL=1